MKLGTLVRSRRKDGMKGEVVAVHGEKAGLFTENELEFVKSVVERPIEFVVRLENGVLQYGYVDDGDFYVDTSNKQR